MLYLIRPDRTMGWIELPTRIMLQAVEDNGLDLAGLGWQGSEKRADDVTVRLALRHGVPCSAGVAMDADFVNLRERPALLREMQRRAQAAQDVLRRHTPVMEQTRPGWTEHGRELHGIIAETHDRAVQEAERELARALNDRSPDPALVAHWAALAGPLPDPH